jgi:hypothetical protein
MSRKKGKEKKEKGKEEEKKNCFDCLHCKVCAKSIFNGMECFCEVKRTKKVCKVTYWQKRDVCKKFDDVSA